MCKDSLHETQFASDEESGSEVEWYNDEYDIDSELHTTSLRTLLATSWWVQARTVI